MSSMNSEKTLQILTFGVLHGMSQPIHSSEPQIVERPHSGRASNQFLIALFSIRMSIAKPHFDFCEVSNMYERKQTNPEETDKAEDRKQN